MTFESLLKAFSKQINNKYKTKIRQLANAKTITNNNGQWIVKSCSSLLGRIARYRYLFSSGNIEESINKKTLERLFSLTTMVPR